ncbi:MAG: phosphoglycerate kinase [Magnetococcales bacterium]|nr:phosphoglycerate kinase [Magnetococcales bacterium]
MEKLNIDSVDLAGKRVFMRADFNIPLTTDGEIREDTRIRAALPTIKKILAAGGRLVLASHLGRPKGAVVPELSLKPVAKRLSELLGQSVPLAPDSIGPQVLAMVDDLQPGGAILLENVRFHAGETKNDPELAAGFAQLADVVVNDAFGTAHRAHASNVGVSNLVSPAVAGQLMAAEIEYFNKAISQPKRPVVAILGGAKVSTKIGVIDALMEKVDKIIIAGAMANTFFKAMGYQVGSSLVEDTMLDVAAAAQKSAKAKGVEFILPVDCVIAQKIENDADTKVVSVKNIPDGWMGLDVGPESLQLFQNALIGVETIVWNGPLGVFEMPPFASGTLGLAQSVANSSAVTVVGGGDTDAAVRQAGVADKISHISTGGGAFLELMEGKNLPGIDALGTI